MYHYILKSIQVIYRYNLKPQRAKLLRPYSAKFNGKIALHYYIPCIHISMQFLAAYRFVVDCDVLGTHYSERDYKCFHIFSIAEPSPVWIVVR